MFKEQLHTSFDSIKPAPELLDRISAMMSEEAAKPKKPIYLNAVKYGSIAAAVVIAAGATIAVVQNANNNSIGTKNTAAPTTAAVTSAAAAAETVAEIASAPETAAADDGSARAGDVFIGAYVPDDTTEMIYDYEEPSEAEAAEVYIAADNASGDAGEGGAVFFATTTAPEIYSAEADENSLSGSSDDTISLFSVQGETHKKEAAEEEIPESEAPAAAMAAPEAAEEPQYDEDYDECLESAEEEYCENYTGITPDGLAYPEAEPAAETEDRANPGTGGFDTMQFEEPFIYQFYTIPETLMKTVDGIIVEETDQWGAHYTVMGEKWREFIGMFAKPTTTPDDEDVPPASADDPPSFRDITAIDEDFNIYTFIEYFNVPDETAREALAGYLTEEQINILLTGDKASVTAEFASGYAIVKGRKIYAPLWLERYSADEWKAAGITQKDIKEKYDTLSQIPYLREDLQKTIIEKMNEYIK